MLCLSSLTLLVSLFVPCCFTTLFGTALNVHSSAQDRGGIASIGKVRPVGRSSPLPPLPSWLSLGQLGEFVSYGLLSRHGSCR